MDTCLFCKISRTEEPSFIIYEDQEFISFLDIRPVFPGHSLLLPKSHIQTLYDLPENQIKSYFHLLQKIGKGIEIAMESEGTFIAINNIVSQSVPHLHTHIIPRNFKDGLKGFFWPRNPYKDEAEMKEIQQKIIAVIDK